MGRGPHALLHKIAEPSSSSSSRVGGGGGSGSGTVRDSCKQRRVNLKMQIPPQDSLPLLRGDGRGGGKKRRARERQEREKRERRWKRGDERWGREKSAARRERTRRITRREKRENFAIYDAAVNHSVVNSRLIRGVVNACATAPGANFIYISFNLGKVRLLREDVFRLCAEFRE